MRLIGPTNETKIILQGVQMKALINTGANMSCVNKWPVETLQLPVQSLQTILNMEGTGGVRVPYYGIVECQLGLPELTEFQKDVLMLVIDDSPYGKRVPVQLGTLHIDMILKAAEQNPTVWLGDSWERAKLTSSLKMGQACAEVQPDEVDLNQLTGNIINMQKVTLQLFESRVISGTAKGPIRTAGISKWVNVLTEPTGTQINEGSCFSAVPSYTYVLPGSSRAKVVLKNLTTWPVTVGRGQMIATIKPGNEVPKMLAPKIDNIENKSGLEVGAWVSKPEEGPREGSCVYLKQGVAQLIEWKLLTAEQLKELHEKLQLEEHTVGWGPELKTKLHELVKEYSFLFAMDSMDLGTTDLIQHHIELTNYTPIKDRYREYHRINMMRCTNTWERCLK